MSKLKLKKARRIVNWLHANLLTVQRYKDLLEIQQSFGKQAKLYIGGDRI